ncbi:hypothetical protein SAMN04489834_2846 [Microterricola viridarii]|uniref:NIPSNAP domain-containing protein n=1 Tax=Microterricola viridarii TaxID=412690 RepID=A0A1H1XP22_9MICO|nr:hypothetical protein SAMN04489834_2846 [Microterricola viridarii]
MVQLRRYQLAPGSYAEFTQWWAERMRPLRLAAGFDIELAYGLPSSEEFVWAVSAPGDLAAFLALEAAYLASEARAEVMRTQPEPALSMQVEFVEQIG